MKIYNDTGMVREYRVAAFSFVYIQLFIDLFFSPSLVSFIPCIHFDCCPVVSDFLFKFLVIGSAGTGKSCLLHQFIENKCKYIINNAF